MSHVLHYLGHFGMLHSSATCDDASMAQRSFDLSANAKSIVSAGRLRRCVRNASPSILRIWWYLNHRCAVLRAPSHSANS
jgi:hypothetical protein